MCSFWSFEEEFSSTYIIETEIGIRYSPSNKKMEVLEPREAERSGKNHIKALSYL
jgi:hypothetical protein